MYPKLQSQRLAGGSNTGSCAAYAYYLEHENNRKIEDGKRRDTIPFFDNNQNKVPVDTVIRAIDRNKKGLHVKDAKFFSLIINPSIREIEKLGATREERIQCLRKMVDKMMDRYAVGFGKDGVKSHKELLYFYTIHEYREDCNGDLQPGIHVHVIVSRKDITGKYKLSPMTNHRGKTSSVIKHGFNRDSFYRDCESIFDTMFGYERRISETYEYLNTMAHGGKEEKKTMVRASVNEENICASISHSLMLRAVRLAEEAACAEAKKQRINIDDKRKKNEFWNSYYTYYHPLLIDLVKQSKAAYSLFRDLKNEGTVIREELNAQCRRLLFNIKLFNTTIQEMKDATTFAELVKSLTAMISYANPIAILILGVLLLIAMDCKTLDNKKVALALRNQAEIIFRRIEALIKEQKKLRYEQNNTLYAYIHIKDEKIELFSKLQELRKELELNHSEIQSKENVTKKEGIKMPTQGMMHNASRTYRILLSAETKEKLDLNLKNFNLAITPVYHPNGGVADLEITDPHEKVLASSSYSKDKLIAVLEHWCKLTGQTPAHRIATDTEANQNIVNSRNPEQKGPSPKRKKDKGMGMGL